MCSRTKLRCAAFRRAGIWPFPGPCWRCRACRSSPAAQQAFSLEDKITSRTPPVFVWHTMEDETVPVENTLLLVSALHRAGVPCEAHLFEKGCHGTSLSTAEVNHPSAHRSRWLTLAREWLDDTFDFHLGTGETGG